MNTTACVYLIKCVFCGSSLCLGEPLPRPISVICRQNCFLIEIDSYFNGFY